MSNEIVRITEEYPQFCTLIAESMEQKKTLYNAVQNPADKVSSFINKQIQISNVYMEYAEYNGDQGTTQGVKTVIITPDGQGILANSMGIAQSLYQIFQIFGMPSEWEEPLTVEVNQIEVKNGRYFKLKVV